MSFGFGTKPGWCGLPLALAAVVLIFAQLVLAQGGPDPCAIKQRYDQAQAAVEKAEEDFRRLKEPDWTKLPRGYFLTARPDQQDNTWYQRIQALMRSMQDDLQKSKKELGALSLKQAQTNRDAAQAQHKALNQQYERKLSDISKLEQAAINLEQEIKALKQNPVMPDGSTAELINSRRQTIEESDFVLKNLVGHADLNVIRFRVQNAAFRDFVSGPIAKAKQELAQAEQAGIAAEKQAAQKALEEAIEQARQAAKSTLAARDQAAKDLGQYQAAIDLLKAIDQKEEELGQTKLNRRNLETQKPTTKDLDAAYARLVEAENKLEQVQTVNKMIPALEALIKSIQPWFNALQKTEQTGKQLEQAKQDYGNAVVAKNTLLYREQDRFNQEQARINQIRTNLQGRVKDQLYYQQLSQMTLHARATYELILINLVDLDCFGDVRYFMDDIKRRIKNLDVARDQILKEASAAAQAAAARPVPVRGTFVRTQVVLGKVPGSGEINDVRFYGSVSATSFSFTSEMKPPYVGKANVSHTWNTPPSTLKPGEIIELGCSSTASKSGPDARNLASNCQWYVEGRVELLEPATQSFAGTFSDGKFYPQGKGKIRFKILPPQGTNNTITITASHSGPWWQDASKEVPAIYKYKFNP
jgi:hypothetical protein